MNAKRFFLTLVIAALATANLAVANAQSEQRARQSNRGWAAIARSGHHATAEPQAETGHDMEIARAKAIEPQAVDPKLRLVGTWIMTIPDAPGVPGFKAFQTYNDDGTMTETSDLLGQLFEGPAHGVWDGRKTDYRVTFQVFSFGPDGLTVGRAQIRVAIRILDDDNLAADAVVDIIEPDGTVIPNVAATPFTGKRMKVVPVN